MIVPEEDAELALLDAGRQLAQAMVCQLRGSVVQELLRHKACGDSNGPHRGGTQVRPPRQLPWAKTQEKGETHRHEGRDGKINMTRHRFTYLLQQARCFPTVYKR